MSTYIAIRAKKLGIKVIEATKPVTIEVKGSDVKKAVPKNSKCCAFALAAQRLDGVNKGYFFRSIAYLEYADKMVRYALPSSLKIEIVSFDRSRKVFPGVYQLSIPKSRKAQKKHNKVARIKIGR